MKVSGELPSAGIGHAAEPDEPQPTRMTAGTPARQDSSPIALGRPASAIKFTACDDLIPRKTLKRKLEEIYEQNTEPSRQDSGEFLQGVYRHLTQRWCNDRSAAADHVGTARYSDIRRAELQAIEGAGYVVQQYGLSVSRISTPEEHQIGPRITNEHSARYHRTNPGEKSFAQCMSIYNAFQHSHSPDKIRFANSMGAARKARDILSGGGTGSTAARDGGPVTDIKHLAHGVVAIEFKTPDDAHRGEKLLEILGGPPSLHEVMKRTHSVPRLATVPDLQIDNASTLASLLRPDEQGPVAALSRLPDGHAMQAAAACAAALLAGLGKTLQRQAAPSKFKHDPLIASALNALSNVAHALPALAGDSPRFAAGYAAMLEELSILLTAAKPYSQDDFKTAALTMLKIRAGKAFDDLRIAPPETYLCSSGMEALLSAGLGAAKTLNGSAQFRGLTEQVSQPLYFEVFKLLKYDGNAMAGKEVFMASLNASLPGRESVSDKTNNWDAKKLVQTMQEWFATHEVHTHRPAVLILDTTVEAQGPDGSSDLAAALAGLKDPVNNGLLKILLCKSYQKYTMGSGKIMAGAITMIARNDPRTEDAARQLKNAEADLDWMQNDESQLLTHFLTHAHASELAMIGSAAKNAAFIDKICLHTRPDAASPSSTRREETTPFVVANFREVGVRARNGADILPVPVSQQVMPQFMRRSGFGYLPTVGFPLDDTQWRITAGQETQAELTEKFYCFGWLNDANVETLTTAAVLSQAHRITGDAAQAVYDNADVGTWAEAALHVLRDRARQGNGMHAAALEECEALLDKISNGRATGENEWQKTQMKGQLRDKLKAELTTLKDPAQSRLADSLKIIGASCAPRLPDSVRAGADVETMQAAIKGAPGGFRNGDAVDLPIDNLRVSLAPNMVASLLKLVGTAFGPQNVSDVDRPALEALYQAALAAGLPRVSASTRSHILLDWSRLQVQGLTRAVSNEAQRTAVDGLLRHVHLVPYREDKAKILASIPENTFTALDPSLQRTLVVALFGPLDAYSRTEFIKTLAENGNSGKATACLAKFKADLEGFMPGAQKILHPYRLSSKARIEAGSPLPIMADEETRIHEQLRAIPIEPNP